MSFGFCQNTDSDEADVMSSGRLFHRFGPAEANDCSPTVMRRDGRHVSNVVQLIRQVPRHSPVKSSVDNDRQFELNLLGRM